MRPLPPWLAGGGAILGMEGGQASVLPRLQAFRAAYPECPVIGVWLQDWSGLFAPTASGAQPLYWNWAWDEGWYPDWRALVANLTADNIKVMTYINHMLINVSGLLTPGAPVYFNEAADAGYFLTLPGVGYRWYQAFAGLPSGAVDLTNPGARAFLKGLIKSNMLATGTSGWMADYGESMPLAAGLGLNATAPAGGLSQAALHNAWPRLWAGLNQEAIAEAEEEGILAAAGLAADDIVYFSRSGDALTPSATRLFWLGDQITTFDGYDGLASAVTGMVSGGLSGLALSHSDLGGYTSGAFAALGLNVTLGRSAELLHRWCELAAFSLVYRTHPGADPAVDWQFDSDAATAALFTRMARVHAAWAPLRAALMAEHAATGRPVVRALALHYGGADPAALTVGGQYLLGSDILVAPVAAANVTSWPVYIPPGAWVWLWDNATVYGNASARIGTNATLPAPLGYPPVLYAAGSAAGAALADALAQAGLLMPPG
jgi:alpha-glucosidase